MRPNLWQALCAKVRRSWNCAAYDENDRLATQCHSQTARWYRAGVVLPLVTNRGKTCEDSYNKDAMTIRDREPWNWARAWDKGTSLVGVVL